MTHGAPDESFYTPAMVQAERELDARIDTAIRTIHETKAHLAELEAKDEQDDTDRQLTDEKVDRLAAYVSEHARTPEWQKVLDKIAQGQLTWRGVVEDAGRDPGIAAAFRSLATLPQPTDEALAELDQRSAADHTAAERGDAPESQPDWQRPGRRSLLGELAEETDADQPERVAPPPPRPSRRRPPDADDDDDEFFERSWMR